VATFLLGAALVPGLRAQSLGTEAQREAGGRLYAARCAQCHGADGRGDGPAADYLRPEPRDFTSSTFKFRTTASGELPTDDDLRRSIRYGMPYSGMPAWPSLSNAEIDNLVYFIKTFTDDFAGPFGDVTALEFPKPAPLTPESIARGREVYLENQCSDCHGFAGRGDGTSAPTLTDTWGHPIRPADLTRRWTFRGGSTREDIFRTFTTGLDGTPMPSYDIQPPEDQWNLVNYVWSLSRDLPDYGTVVRAMPAPEGAALDTALFAHAPPVLLPVVGQVIEARRAFHPASNAIEVRAAYGPDHVSLMLAWNDMTADTTGLNGPGMDTAGEDTTIVYSDAVAVQFPTVAPEGTELPYFLFGDRKNAVDLWVADLAGPSARHWIGRGYPDLAEEGPPIELRARYHSGRWVVLLRRSRVAEGHITFEPGGFVPAAFSVWDGFAREGGSRRGVTAWYHVYLEPSDRPSPVGPVITYALLTLVLGLGITVALRKKHGGT
jgi:DMSO reductase family type II enzyme heme b subunit